MPQKKNRAHEKFHNEYLTRSCYYSLIWWNERKSMHSYLVDARGHLGQLNSSPVNRIIYSSVLFRTLLYVHSSLINGRVLYRLLYNVRPSDYWQMYSYWRRAPSGTTSTPSSTTFRLGDQRKPNNCTEKTKLFHLPIYVYIHRSDYSYFFRLNLNIAHQRKPSKFRLQCKNLKMLCKYATHLHHNGGTRAE